MICSQLESNHCLHYLYTCSYYVDIFYSSTALQIIGNYVIKALCCRLSKDRSHGKDDLITILEVILLYNDQ